MPRFDKTGPAGQGPTTGRGLGACVGNQQTGFGGGFGRGRGRCYGRGWGFSQGENFPVSLDEEEKFLKQRLEDIQKAKKKSK